MASRGRPKGAISFVNIDMETLTKLFNNSQAIPVSRVWLEKLNIEIENTNVVNSVKSMPKPTSEEKIKMTLSA
jgi:hypothetical protein